MNLFPFGKLRKGQRQLLEKTKQTLEKETNLLVHAPTGIGKTAAVLSPALEYALENNKTILFLTPRHSQHKIVIDTLRKIQDRHGIELKVTDLIGKKWLCNVPDIEALPSSDFGEYCRMLKERKGCEYRNNTWSDSGELTEDAKKTLEKLDKKIMHAEEAKKSCMFLCPYEIFLQRARNSNIIIADYFHIFNPSVQKAFMVRLNKSFNDLIFIIDEAHNLPERVRSSLSANISDYQLERCANEAMSFNFPELANILEALNKKLISFARAELRAKDETFIEKSDIAGMINKIGNYESFLEMLEDAAKEIREEKKRSFIGGLLSFLEGWNGSDVGFTRILKRASGKTRDYFVFSYHCLDPGVITSSILDQSHSSILMSGTLAPLTMYRKVLGLEESCEKIQLDSPFSRKNCLNLVTNDVTTRYTQRTEKEFLKISGYIVKLINKNKGNVGVFFPSYKMRNKIFQIIERSLDKKPLLEEPNMSKEEKTGLYNEFVNLAEQGSCLFGVVGGSFNEGADFPGKAMTMVILVGLPLNRPDLLTKALIRHYDHKFNRGWDYGYIYPAMTKAIQTAGRLIRSEDDRGIVVFMDKRYLWPNYKKLLPPETELKIIRDIDKEIKEFF